MQAVHQQQGGAMCEMEEDERRQQHRRATTGVCERGEALCEDAEQQVRTMMLVVRESMRRRYISQRYFSEVEKVSPIYLSLIHI